MSILDIGKKLDSSVYFNNYVLQLMPKDKFCNGFIAFTRTKLPESNTLFYLYGSEKTGYIRSKESGIIESSSSTKINTYIDIVITSIKAKAIICNWVSPQILLCLFPFIKKTYLLFWGGDIYQFTQSDEITGLKGEVEKWIVRASIRRARGILTLLPSDLREVEKVSPKHGKWMMAAIPFMPRAENYLWRYSYRTRGTTRILLGNSATTSNRHADMLIALSHFSGEDIEVIAPLSYGDAAYAERVIELGKELLGEKFIPLSSFMEIGAYEELLETIDIGVFNHNRQQGMGNINRLMMGGSKIYISPDSGMWEDFANEGRCFFSSRTIGEISFEEFVDWDEHRARKNWELLNPGRRMSKAIKQWRAIYRDCFQ